MNHHQTSIAKAFSIAIILSVASTTRAQSPETEPVKPVAPANPEMKPAPPEPASLSEKDDEKAKEQERPPLSRREIAIWSLVGVTGAAVIVGGIFGLNALDEKERYENNPSNDFKDRSKSRAIVADVFFGVAGASAATALILWLFDRKEAKSNSTETATVSIGKGGTSLLVTF